MYNKEQLMKSLSGDFYGRSGHAMLACTVQLFALPVKASAYGLFPIHLPCLCVYQSIVLDSEIERRLVPGVQRKVQSCRASLTETKQVHM